MASPKQRNNVNQLNALWASQLAGQQAGLPGFATVMGSTQGPAQAAAGGAPPGTAAQFAAPAASANAAGTPGQPAIAGAIQPGTPQGLNRAQKLAGLQANIAAALKAPPPGKGKAAAAIIGGAKGTPQAQQQLTTTQQARIIAREAQRYFRGAARNGSDFLSNLSTPGDVWFPVLVLLVLMIVIVPIAGADGKLHTRLGWLWLVLIGQAHVAGEILTKPTPASGFTTSGNVPAPGAQNPYPGALGSCDCPPLQQPCDNAKKQADGTCDCCQPIYPGGIPVGSGGVPRTVIAQPLYTGNATLGLEDYL